MRLRIVQDGRPSPSPGMNTMVTVFCSAGDMHSLSVSSGAVLQKNGKAAVFVYDPSKGTVRSCEVTVLRLLTNGRSVITSDALQPGRTCRVHRECIIVRGWRGGETVAAYYIN